MKHRRTKRRGERGQTTIEYLLLLSAAFITTYLVMTGPMGTFARLMIATVRSAIINVVQNGELTPGEVLRPGEAGHPGDPARAKALH